jgi:hypothetical protein
MAHNIREFLEVLVLVALLRHLRTKRGCHCSSYLSNLSLPYCLQLCLVLWNKWQYFYNNKKFSDILIYRICIGIRNTYLVLSLANDVPSNILICVLQDSTLYSLVNWAWSYTVTAYSDPYIVLVLFTYLFYLFIYLLFIYLFTSFSVFCCSEIKVNLSQNM